MLSKRIQRFVTIDALIAFLYISFGLLSTKLGFLFATPFIFSAAAAVAFIALLHLGVRALPGILFGSFTLTLLTTPPYIDQRSLYWVSGFFAAGAGIQAWCGAWLIKRLAKINWQRLALRRDIVLFLVLSGPLTALISASFGCAALYLASSNSTAPILPTWLHWWVSDTLGLMILSPLLLTLLYSKQQPWRNRLSHVVLPTILALIVTFASLIYVYHSEKYKIDQQLHQSELAIKRKLDIKLKAYEEAVVSVTHLMNTFPNTQYNEFELFTHDIFTSYPELQALSWNPYVLDSEKLYFEEALSRQFNITSLQLTKQLADGSIFPVERKAWYVPIAYIAPLQTNEKALGYDISSNKLRFDALKRATLTHKMAMTAPIKLVQSAERATGVLFVFPLFTDSPATPKGFAVGVIELEKLIHNLLSNNVAEGLDIVISDINSTYQYPLFDSRRSVNQSLSSQSLNTTLEIGGRVWELSIIPTQTYIDAHSFFVWQVLLIGSILTCLLQAFLLYLSGRHFLDTKQLRLSASVFHRAHEGIIVTDTEGSIVEINPAFSHITGYSKADVLGKNASILSSSQHDHIFYKEMWNAIHTQGFWSGEVWNRKKSGEVYAERLTISPITNGQDQVSYYVGLFSDITTFKEQQSALELMAHYDVLTGLPNRVLFAGRSTQAFAHSLRTETLLAVCFLDIDHFKRVNDTFGHQLGDQLLSEVAKRIQSAIRDEDTVSRLGGDEFTILLGDLASHADCITMLQRLLAVLTEPYHLHDKTLQITVSCGITLYPYDNSDLDTLVRHADQAMYRAKLAGRNQFQFFDIDNDQEIIQKRLRLNEIEQAFNAQQFSLYYQPKVNMETGEVFGVEALIRWSHPEQGLIYPLEFLPILNGTELELQIGDWVLNEALKQLQTWQNEGIFLSVSINIASAHLQSPLFVGKLLKALAQFPEINPNTVQLEILESSALGDLNKISRIIKLCQEQAGVQFALDDFGTGYSSLTHLRNLQSNVIKIDQSFVRDILDDQNDFAIVDGVIGLAHSFNQEPIAEGVESTDHGILLLSMGCINAQGNGISVPLPATEVSSWLKAYSPNDEWLKFAKGKHGPKEKRIIQLKLVTTRWFNLLADAVNNNTANPTPQWPILSSHRYHYQALINRARKEGLINIQVLNQVEAMFIKMNDLTSAIIELYRNQELEQARALVQEVKEMHRLLMLHLQ